ncbi:hypothetical protein VTO42DRAFT_4249 [Malbranchea cinnamomea]
MVTGRSLRSKKDLEIYARLAVEQHIQEIIAALCKILDAREKLRLGDQVRFENHASNVGRASDEHISSTSRPTPDQYCIHRVEGAVHILITTVEYKHKLSVENLRVGLGPMEFWERIVEQETIPADKDEKLKYNAERLAGSAVAQQYHVMIQEGLEYSYVTNGLALVVPRVRITILLLPL